MTEKKNKKFFDVLRTLIIIFEFDKTYPEARRILLVDRKKRSDKKKSVIPGLAMFGGITSIMSKGLGMLNFMNALKGD